MEMKQRQLSSVHTRCRKEMASLSKSLEWHDENDLIESILQSIENKIDVSGVTTLQIMQFLIPSAVSPHGLKNLVQLFLRKISVLMDELQILKKDKLATEALAIVKNFWSLVSNQHVVITKQAFGIYRPEMYVVLPSLASVYVDLFIAVHGTKVKTNKLSKKLYGWLMFELNERCLKTALLEVSECTEEGARLLLPMLRKLLSILPQGESHLDYLLHMILLKRWSFVCKELKDLLQMSLEIKAPKKFVEWLTPLWPQAHDHLPMDKSLRGRRVTEVLLELDQQAVEELIDVFSQCLWALDQDTVLEGESNSEPKDGAGVEMMDMDTMFIIDKKGVEQEQVDEDLPPPKKRKKKLTSQESEDWESPFDKEAPRENFIDENVDNDEDDTDIFMLPGLLDEDVNSERKKKIEDKAKGKAVSLKEAKNGHLFEDTTVMGGPERKEEDLSGLDAKRKGHLTKKLSLPKKDRGIVMKAGDESEDEEREMEWSDDIEDSLLKDDSGMDKQEKDEEEDDSDGDDDEEGSDDDYEEDSDDDDEHEVEMEKKSSDESLSNGGKVETGFSNMNEEQKKSPARIQDTSASKTPKLNTSADLGFVVDRSAAKLSSPEGRRKSSSESKDPALSYFVDRTKKSEKLVQTKSAREEDEPDVEVIDGMEIQVFNVGEDIPEVNIEKKETVTSPARKGKGRNVEDGMSSETPSRISDKLKSKSSTESRNIHIGQTEVNEKGDNGTVKLQNKAELVKLTPKLSAISVVISSESDGDSVISVSDSNKKSGSHSTQNSSKKTSKSKLSSQQAVLDHEDIFVSIKERTLGASSEPKSQKRPRTRSESSAQNEVTTKMPGSLAVGKKEGGSQTNSPHKGEENAQKTTEYQIGLMLSEMRKSIEAGKLSHTITRLKRKSESTTDSLEKEDQSPEKQTVENKLEKSVKKLQCSPTDVEGIDHTPRSPVKEKQKQRSALTSVKPKTPQSTEKDSNNFTSLMKDWLIQSPKTPSRTLRQVTPKDVTDKDRVERRSSQRKRKGSSSNNEISLDVSESDNVTPRLRKKSNVDTTPLSIRETNETILSAKENKKSHSPAKVLNTSLTDTPKKAKQEKLSTLSTTSIKGTPGVEELNKQSAQSSPAKSRKSSSTSPELDQVENLAKARSSEKVRTSSAKRRYFLRTNCSHRSYDSAECPTCTPKRKTRQSEKETASEGEKQVTPTASRSSSRRSVTRSSSKSPAMKRTR